MYRNNRVKGTVTFCSVPYLKGYLLVFLLELLQGVNKIFRILYKLLIDYLGLELFKIIKFYKKKKKKKKKYFFYIKK